MLNKNEHTVPINPYRAFRRADAPDKQPNFSESDIIYLPL